MEGQAGHRRLYVSKERDIANIHVILSWYQLGSLLQTMSPGILSHSPLGRQVAVIIPLGNSPSSHWKVTRVPGTAGTE